MWRHWIIPYYQSFQPSTPRQILFLRWRPRYPTVQNHFLYRNNSWDVQARAPTTQQTINKTPWVLQIHLSGLIHRNPSVLFHKIFWDELRNQMVHRHTRIDHLSIYLHRSMSLIIRLCGSCWGSQDHRFFDHVKTQQQAIKTYITQVPNK